VNRDKKTKRHATKRGARSDRENGRRATRSEPNAYASKRREGAGNARRVKRRWTHADKRPRSVNSNERLRNKRSEHSACVNKRRRGAWPL